ncbi:hypothetical protein RJD24_17475 [Bacillaceae bacterium IKA-2]|nr:hypothetical protein RJD24_17475 [Bacillaceae bacterium IKA-2]
MKQENQTKVNLLHFGLGPIGLEILKASSQVHNLNTLGAIDLDPSKVGQDIGDLIGIDHKNVKVTDTLQDLPSFKEDLGKVAIHATGSNLENVWPQIKQLLDHGFSVVSTCEELAYPWHRYPQLAEEINNYAKQKGLAVIGTGVNPGFIMDTMTLCLTTVTNEVGDITVTRKVDVSKRRIPLQKKVGIGMTEAAFYELVKENKVGHVGLVESARLIAYGLGVELSEVSNTIHPTIADRDYQIALGNLKKGQVSGQHQIVRAKTTDNRTITLELIMAVAVNQEDRIQLAGKEPIELVIPNGIFGDTATAAMAINTAKIIGTSCFTGLVTMADIKLPRNINVAQKEVVPYKEAVSL